MQLVVALTLVFLGIFGHASAGSCVGLGERCSWTVFSPCCGNSVCQLDFLLRGTCVACKAPGRFCLSDDECCNKDCSVLSCR
ncbi:hypothetical protein D915_009308 [Fasciola hepatica]|uniref:UPF0506 domain-containing protein n=1 Tax=Fasciola hepatica TaxID=6192 RepID=A0A4E0R3H6_FASHE|nr:hypothetical protein D915_009308 [Fasciola hepatica]